MIHWNYGPDLLHLGPVVLRWYGILFAFAFYLGFRYVRYFFGREGYNVVIVDRLLIYIIVGTIAGARLGHCLFYEPDIYLHDPIRILMVWEGGLASHGGTLGVILALLVFSRRYKIPYLWLLDRVSTPVPLCGALVRVGNFFNSEILGAPTGGRWGVVFDKIDQLPRHPAQLYESAAYFALFFGLFLPLYKKTGLRRKPGFFFGLFLVAVYGVRFFIEFVKENQVAFEQHLPLNMGQLLSVPAVAVGAFFIWRSFRVTPYAEVPGKAKH